MASRGDTTANQVTLSKEGGTIEHMVEQSVFRVTVGPKGRIVIPAPLRRQLGIEEGDRLSMAVIDGVIELATPAGALEKIRQMFAEKIPPGVDLVAELFEDRRLEFERELREEQEILRRVEQGRKTGS
jgi:AbrB family looped-hinge helix DNA binding protein